MILLKNLLFLILHVHDQLVCVNFWLILVFHYTLLLCLHLWVDNSRISFLNHWWVQCTPFKVFSTKNLTKKFLYVSPNFLFLSPSFNVSCLSLIVPVCFPVLPRTEGSPYRRLLHRFRMTGTDPSTTTPSGTGIYSVTPYYRKRIYVTSQVLRMVVSYDAIKSVPTFLLVLI